MAENDVNFAMSQQRAEKVAVRKLWVSHLQSYDLDSEDLLYLTLCGADGSDIQALVDAGLITLTESGAIPKEWQSRLAAVESGNQEVFKLQKKFPGLKIFHQPFQNLVQGNALLSYPRKGEHHDACRAKVINLDLNTVISAEVTNGELAFPIIRWIEKLGQIHRDNPTVNWSLYLTLHGEIQWDDQTSNFAGRLLRENFELIPEFRNECELILGEAFVEQVESNLPDDNLSRIQQQRLLLLFVPKLIYNEIIGQSWKIETVHNLLYGDETQQHAPMVTWVLSLERGSGSAQQIYQANVTRIPANIGQINPLGELVEL